MIESVVRRAKKLALKRYIAGGQKGIMVDDLLTAVREEFKENEDLPNTTNPDDWAKDRREEGGADRVRQAPHGRDEREAAKRRKGRQHGSVPVAKRGAPSAPPTLIRQWGKTPPFPPGAH